MRTCNGADNEYSIEKKREREENIGRYELEVCVRKASPEIENKCSSITHTKTIKCSVRYQLTLKNPTE